ncbi:MAG: DNA mismatch repair endonuclease MutL, partial [Chloroflexi bacterium]|nr:DNA mismatch repair endonuclease MutL [Chloroflexota bacterium]
MTLESSLHTEPPPGADRVQGASLEPMPEPAAGAAAGAAGAVNGVPQGRVAMLSADVAGKIAAGECVERPASVVKELVENALDAGATRIHVEMEDGGRALIRVNDNGRGMTQDDMVLAVQRHATSKIRGLEDLGAIQTLGFRGEALPSIAAVSRLEIVSTVQDGVPSRLLIEGGDVVDLRACGAPGGTSVAVRDLFFNTPARLKFLRSAQTEFGHALEHLTRLAIAHHRVAFRVVHNGRETLNTPGSPDALNAIVAAYGPDTGREMVRVGSETAPIRVSGYVSRPAFTRANRSQQSFFVNRRWVRNRTIGHALDQAYRTLLTVGRHPVAAIMLDIDSGLVDVNVHPTKAEVRFLREWEVHQAVSRAVKDALLGVSLVPEVQIAARTPSHEPAATLWDTSTVERSPSGPFDPLPGRGPSGSGSPEFRGAGVENESDWQSVPEDPYRGSGAGTPLSAREAYVGADLTAHGSSSIAASCAPLAGARIVGQMHRCYIVAETPAGIILIDQHAAHERILYEKFLQRGERFEVQSLVVPMTLNLGHREAALATDRLADFEALGFQMEPFGPGAFLVRSVPLLGRRQNYEELIRDLVDELASVDFGRKMRLRRDHIAASMACRAAIKQGDSLSLPEMNALLDDLCGVDNPLDLPTN